MGELMTLYRYSPSTGGFYAEGRPDIPADAIGPVEDERRLELLQGQAEGLEIYNRAGVLDMRPPLPPERTRAEIEALRLVAYADPHSGSDRFFAEAQREQLLGNAEAAEVAKAKGVQRFAEIRAMYPWPGA